MNQFFEWLKYLILALAAWGAFWSYSMIKGLNAQVQQLAEINAKITTQVEAQCEDLGFVKPEAEPDVDNP